MGSSRCGHRIRWMGQGARLLGPFFSFGRLRLLLAGVVGEGEVGQLADEGLGRGIGDRIVG